MRLIRGRLLITLFIVVLAALTLQWTPTSNVAVADETKVKETTLVLKVIYPSRMPEWPQPPNRIFTLTAKDFQGNLITWVNLYADGKPQVYRNMRPGIYEFMLNGVVFDNRCAGKKLSLRIGEYLKRIEVTFYLNGCRIDVLFVKK